MWFSWVSNFLLLQSLRFYFFPDFFISRFLGDFLGSVFFVWKYIMYDPKEVEREEQWDSQITWVLSEELFHRVLGYQNIYALSLSFNVILLNSVFCYASESCLRESKKILFWNTVSHQRFKFCKKDLYSSDTENRCENSTIIKYLLLSFLEE